MLHLPGARTARQLSLKPQPRPYRRAKTARACDASSTRPLLRSPVPRSLSSPTRDPANATMGLKSWARNEWSEAKEAGREIVSFVRHHDWKKSARQSVKRKYWGAFGSSCVQR
mgnify:CR=1 FL=1